MKRDLSQTGLDLIKSFEGLKLKSYKALASEQYYTIGYGHYGSDVKANMTITEEQAIALLKADCKKFINHINTYMDKYNFNQNEFDALVSFAYNVGSIKQLTASGTRSKETIAKKMLEYNKSGGKVIKGLTTRRMKERDLFVTPIVYDDYYDIAIDVINGKYGNGTARNKKITSMGYDYKKVQVYVNKILKGEM